MTFNSKRARMAKGKYALITGGTRGIGLAVADALVRSGYGVVLNYLHDDAQARAAARQWPDAHRVRLSRADVTKPSEVASMIEEMFATERRIDVLVNNVGSFLYKPFLDTTIDEWTAILQSNLMSAVLCCQHVLPPMREQGTGQIISIASMHAEMLRAVPNTLPYAISKTGIVLMTKSLAKTEGRYGIRVNAICPGYVRTGDYPPDDPAKRIPLGRMADPREIGEAAAFLVSDRASYITGAILNVHGGALI